MPVDAKHPEYGDLVEDWKVMRDCYGGETKIKAEGTRYLPATSTQIADGVETSTQKGYKVYQSYKLRAVYHNFVADCVEAAIGIMHRKKPKIELPAKMEYLRKTATPEGENLEQLLRRMNEEQLVSGRIGLLLDFPEAPVPAGEVKFYIAPYKAESIINWDNGKRDEPEIQSLNLVVLNESEFVRTEDFDWEYKEKFRVLKLGDELLNEVEGSGATYSVAVVDKEEDISAFEYKTPSILGQTLDQVPFVFVNSKDNVASPDNPPLIDLAKLSLAIYRGEADYRLSLFQQSQDTLVITGNPNPDDEVRVGANQVLNVPIGGDAKYIGVDSKGLEEQRLSLQNDKQRAERLGGQLLDMNAGEKESGEALKIRVAANTATLTQVALSSAAGLQYILRVAAKWLGLNPDEVVVAPNLDFADDELTGRNLVELQTFKTLGGPISSESIHELMQQRGVTRMSFEEEIDAIMEEDPVSTGVGVPEEPDPVVSGNGE